MNWPCWWITSGRKSSSSRGETPAQRGPGGEGEVEADTDNRLSGSVHDRQPHDAQTVALLLGRGILVGRGDHQDVVPSRA